MYFIPCSCWVKFMYPNIFRCIISFVYNTCSCFVYNIIWIYGSFISFCCCTFFRYGLPFESRRPGLPPAASGDRRRARQKSTRQRRQEQLRLAIIPRRTSAGSSGGGSSSFAAKWAARAEGPFGKASTTSPSVGRKLSGRNLVII